MTSRRSETWTVLLVALSGVLLGLYYFLAIDVIPDAYALRIQDGVIEGSVLSPYRYRVLSPFLLEGLMQPWIAAPGRAAALTQALAVFDLAGYAFQAVAVYIGLRAWFPPARAAAGWLFLACVCHVTFGYFLYHPWSILEVGFFAIGLAAWQAKRDWLLLPIVVLAALNRETGVFIPLACLAGTWWAMGAFQIRQNLSDRRIQLLIGYLLLSVAIFGLLRLLRGGAPPIDQLGDVLILNWSTDNRPRAFWGILLMFGVAWGFALRGLRKAPVDLRGACWVVLPYLVAFAVWGTWREMRLLTTLYPLLLPLALFAIAPPVSEPEGNHGSA
jgi:hypothetical protein